MKDWAGLLKDRRSDAADTELKLPLERSKNGGSGAFRARGMDDQEYFVKPLNNSHGARILVAEQVVGRVGALIDGPTCSVRRITIGDDHVGWQYTEGGLKLERGIAHASTAIEGCFELRPPLQYRSDDDNARRHAQIYALYDWCWGADTQWLVAELEERRYYSHDHGFYFPPEGVNWSIADLQSNVGVAREFSESYAGLRRQHVEEVAQALEGVTRAALADALAAIPTSWPASDEELECIGYFLEHRALDSAARMRTHLEGLP